MRKRTTGHLFPFLAVFLCLTSCGGTNSDSSTDAMDTQSQADESIDPDAIRPFEINVSEATLVDLRLRLSQRRLPDQIAGTGWDYGTDRTCLEELLGYWEHDFDWREQEATINSKPQSTDWISISSINARPVKTRFHYSSPTDGQGHSLNSRRLSVHLPTQHLTGVTLPMPFTSLSPHFQDSAFRTNQPNVDLIQSG